MEQRGGDAQAEFAATALFVRLTSIRQLLSTLRNLEVQALVGRCAMC